jgi:hypothetical protein
MFSRERHSNRQKPGQEEKEWRRRRERKKGPSSAACAANNNADEDRIWDVWSRAIWARPRKLLAEVNECDILQPRAAVRPKKKERKSSEEGKTRRRGGVQAALRPITRAGRVCMPCFSILIPSNSQRNSTPIGAVKQSRNVYAGQVSAEHLRSAPLHSDFSPIDRLMA